MGSSTTAPEALLLEVTVSVLGGGGGGGGGSLDTPPTAGGEGDSLTVIPSSPSVSLSLHQEEGRANPRLAHMVSNSVLPMDLYNLPVCICWACCLVRRIGSTLLPLEAVDALLRAESGTAAVSSPVPTTPTASAPPTGAAAAALREDFNTGEEAAAAFGVCKGKTPAPRDVDVAAEVRLKATPRDGIVGGEGGGATCVCVCVTSSTWEVCWWGGGRGVGMASFLRKKSLSWSTDSHPPVVFSKTPPSVKKKDHHRCCREAICLKREGSACRRTRRVRGATSTVTVSPQMSSSTEASLYAPGI